MPCSDALDESLEDLNVSHEFIYPTETEGYPTETKVVFGVVTRELPPHLEVVSEVVGVI